MSNNDPGYSRVNELISRISQYTGHQIPVYSRPLEAGVALQSGGRGYIAQVSTHELLALFTFPIIPDDSIIEDIIAHAVSTGAANAVILACCHEEIWYSCTEIDNQDWGGKFIEREIQLNFPKILQNLSYYLADLRRDLNGWHYRREGEISESVRDLTVQALMHQVILNRMVIAHANPPGISSGGTVWNALMSFATTIPIHDKYTLRPTEITVNEKEEIISILSGKKKPELINIRLSWIEPETWAFLFDRHLNTLKKKYHRHSDEIAWSHRETPGLVIESPSGKMLIEALSVKMAHFFPGKIFDPCSGSGQILAIVLRLIRMKRVNSEEPDTVMSRLITAGSSIFASDKSSLHIHSLRFVIVIWILGGDMRAQVLSEDSLLYPLMDLTNHIQTGSLLFGEDISNEFISVQEGFPVIRNLHPLDPFKNTQGQIQFSLIITFPRGILPVQIPEVTSYLTKHFQSFQRGITAAPIYLERTSPLIAPGGVVVVLLPAKWISESLYQGFRKWVKQTLPVTIIGSNNYSGRVDLTNLSVIILQKKPNGAHWGPQAKRMKTIFMQKYENTLRIIRVQAEKNNGNPYCRDYSIPSEYLSEEDGWHLDDPWEENLLRNIPLNTMPLSGYLFDELFSGASGTEKEPSHDGWTSVTFQNGDILINQGEVPDIQACAIIPGRDFFLMGLLSSSLMKWYTKVIISHQNSTADNLTWFSNLPIAITDHYDEVESQIHGEIEQKYRRITFLKRKRIIAHCYHDQNRLNQQISKTQNELNLLVFRLYKISEPDTDEINKRVNRTLSDTQKPEYIDIF